MGKARRIRPTGFASRNPLGANFLENFDEYDCLQSSGPVEAIRDQLLSPNIEEKIHGLQALAVVALNKSKVDEIIQTDIVRISAPYLCDNDTSLRNATAGALRNLSIGGEDVCEWLTNQDLLTPLIALIKEYIEDSEWTPKFDSTLCEQLDIKSDIFLHAINIIWNLCETTSVALEIFNGTRLTGGLIRCLNHNIYGYDIAISTAQCLLVLSENNPKSWILLNDHVDSLLEVLQASSKNYYGQAYLVSLCAGILANVPALATAHTPLILNSLATILEIDYCSAAKKRLRLLNSDEHDSNSFDVADTMETDIEETEAESARRRRREEQPSKADLCIREVSYLLDGQRVAAEVIANLCSGEDEDDVNSEDSMSEIVEDVADDTNENYVDIGVLSSDIVEVIKAGNLLEKLWLRSQPVSEDIALLLRSCNTNFISKISNLQISSLLCLNNLTSCLTLEDMGGAASVYNVWVKLGQHTFQSNMDVRILEPSTALMRAVLDKLRVDKSIFSEVSENDIEILVTGATEIDMPEIRANCLRMLGGLACVLQSEELVRYIVSFLLTTCQKELDCWTISEGLDAFMDVFAEDNWNNLIAELNLINSCKELEITFKTRLRNQRRELKERYHAVLTVRTNFTRFIKYMEELKIN